MHQNIWDTSLSLPRLLQSGAAIYWTHLAVTNCLKICGIWKPVSQLQLVGTSGEKSQG